MPSRHLETALECLNKNVDMKVSEYDAYLEKPSSGMTLIIKRLERKYFKKVFKSKTPKGSKQEPKGYKQEPKGSKQKPKGSKQEPKI